MTDVLKISTVEEVLHHPAYPDASFNLKPTRSGLATVAEGRGGPIKLSWQIHGDGPTKLLFIMGIGAFKTAWQRQTLFFGHENYQDYSMLVFDNRGMGGSDKPLMRYSTSEMALDTLELLEQVGFVEGQALQASDSPAATIAFAPASQRSVHVVGFSMGGMIAQELACRAPDMMASLSLCCTAAVMENTAPSVWQNLKGRAALIIPTGIEESIRGVAGRIFSEAWLVKPDDVMLPQQGTHLVGPPQRHLYGVTDGENGDPADADLPVSTDAWYRRFDTNYQRFVAQELHKRADPRFSTVGYLMQLIACGWHRKSPAQLAAMADAVGRERILVIHGTADKMISLPHGHKLIEYIQPGTSHIVEGMGHAPVMERCAWFNALIAQQIKNGEKLAGR